MIRIRNLIIIILLLSIIVGVEKTGTSAAKFLSIGSGAEAVGMGGAYTSVAKGASTMYWNPAGISKIRWNEFYFDHSSWLADLRYDYIGLILPMEKNITLGINITSLSMPQMNITYYGNENTGETFKAGSYAIGFSGAMSLTNRFSIGFNTKYIREFISNSHASSFAIDTGTLFNTSFGPVIGMSISNFGPKLQINGSDLLIKTDGVSNNSDINANLSTEKFNLPLSMRFGVSNNFVLNKINILIAIDAVNPIDNSEYINFGGEISLKEKLFIRAGMKSLFMVDRETLFTMGLGAKLDLFSYNKIHLDYAYEIMHYLNDIHKFSIRITK